MGLHLKGNCSKDDSFALTRFSRDYCYVAKKYQAVLITHGNVNRLNQTGIFVLLKVVVSFYQLALLGNHLADKNEEVG